MAYEDIDNLITNSKAHLTSLWATSTPKLARVNHLSPAQVRLGLARAIAEETPSSILRTESAENHVHIFQDVTRQALDMDLPKRGHKKTRSTTSSRTNLMLLQMYLLLTGSTRAMTTAWYAVH